MNMRSTGKKPEALVRRAVSEVLRPLIVGLFVEIVSLFVALARLCDLAFGVERLGTLSREGKPQSQKKKEDQRRVDCAFHQKVLTDNRIPVKIRAFLLFRKNECRDYSIASNHVEVTVCITVTHWC